MNTEKLNEALEKLAQAWNAYLAAQSLSPLTFDGAFDGSFKPLRVTDDDLDDFRKAIHDGQRIIQSKLYRSSQIIPQMKAAGTSFVAQGNYLPERGPIPKEPKPEDYGYYNTEGLGYEKGGWRMEGGELAYLMALEEWKTKNAHSLVPEFPADRLT